MTWRSVSRSRVKITQTAIVRMHLLTWIMCEKWVKSSLQFTYSDISLCTVCKRAWAVKSSICFKWRLTDSQNQQRTDGSPWILLCLPNSLELVKWLFEKCHFNIRCFQKAIENIPFLNLNFQLALLRHNYVYLTVRAKCQFNNNKYSRNQTSNFMLSKSCLDVMSRMSCDDIMSWVTSCHHNISWFKLYNSCFIQSSYNSRSCKCVDANFHFSQNNDATSKT